MARLVNEGLSADQSRNLQKLARLVFGKGVRYVSLGVYQETKVRRDEDGNAVKGEDGYTIYDTVGYRLTEFLGFDSDGKPMLLDPDGEAFAPLAEIASNLDALQKAGFSTWRVGDALRPWFRNEPFLAGNLTGLLSELCAWLGQQYADLLPLDESRHGIYHV